MMFAIDRSSIAVTAALAVTAIVVLLS